jgi:hypothetical protein
MRETCFSKTSVHFQMGSRRYIPEFRNLRELKFYSELHNLYYSAKFCWELALRGSSARQAVNIEPERVKLKNIHY